MAQVTVAVNGRRYPISCDDGQEAHLARLGTYIDKRVGELVAAVGQVGDAQLLVMVSLLIADELSDAYTELDALRADDNAATRADAEDQVAEAMDRMAERVERIAERIEAP